MRVGLATFLRGDGIHAGVLAREAEARGFSSLYLTEHTHIPVAAGMVDRNGGPLDDKYRRTHDPFIALAFAAAATSNLTVGTSVSLIIQHDPIVLAKVVSSLDVLSGGRFVLGVGAGWNKREMANHRTDPATRHRRMRETVEAMRAIWRDDEASYHGQLIDFDPIWQWPKAANVPVYVGGNGPRVEDRVLRYGDGWMPNMPDTDELARRVAALRERAGRRVPVIYYGATAENLDAVRAADVDEALIVLPSGPEAEVLASIPSLK
jgi:probable F420-dependent oxidoreductase